MRIREPFQNVPIVESAGTVGGTNRTTTIVAQKIAGGTAPVSEVLTNITETNYIAKFGEGSEAAEAFRAFRAINETSVLNFILVPVTGTTAAGSVDFTGSTATEDGTLDFYIGDEDKKATVAITTGDDGDTIADNLKIAIDAVSNSVVETGTVATGALPITALNDGLQGNKIGIRVEGEVAGVVVALTRLTGGTGTPDLSGIGDLLKYRTDLICAYEYDVSDLTTYLESVFNTENNVLDGQLITVLEDTVANTASVGVALNKRTLTIVANPTVDISVKKSGVIFATPINIASRHQATRALRLNTGSDISSIMVSDQALDNIGGAHTASMPYFNTVLQGLPIIPTSQLVTSTEQQQLIDAGIAVIGNNTTGTAILMGTTVTTYKTNSKGLEDVTFKYQSYLDTISLCREYIVNLLAINYAQSRLNGGNNIVTGYGSATVGLVRSDMQGAYKTLSGAGWVLLQSGSNSQGKEISVFFDDNLTVLFDEENGVIDITAVLPLMTQVRRINAPLTVAFDTTAQTVN